jgi:SPP1 gp7 family putative phage head morphogenesis protein
MAKNNDITKINTNLIKQQARNIEYWQKRAESKFLDGEKDALELAKQLQANYKRTIREIEFKINAFYGKYASKEGIELQEAKQLLNRQELKEFKDYIKEMLAMGKKENFSPEQMAKFKQLYAKARISRLQELEAEIEYELSKLTSANEEQLAILLANTYEEGYYETIFDVEKFKGFSSSFSGLNKQAIGKAIYAKYEGANFSQRLWKNQTNLITILEKEIPRGITLGYNPRKLADLTSKKLGTNYNNTVRLIRTEYNKVLNDATYQGYVACRIAQYQILATLDNRTSEICQEMDSKIYELSEKEVGVNYPPFHPNCRTTTIPYFEPDEFDNEGELIYNDKLGIAIPKNITYKEWKDNLTQPRNGKIHYKGGE